MLEVPAGTVKSWLSRGRSRLAELLSVDEAEEIAAPIAVVFETILEQMGPRSEAPGSGPMPMKLEVHAPKAPVALLIGQLYT